MNNFESDKFFSDRNSQSPEVKPSEETKEQRINDFIEKEKRDVQENLNILLTEEERILLEEKKFSIKKI